MENQLADQEAKTLGLVGSKLNTSALSDLSMILSDVHGQISSLEQKLDLVSLHTPETGVAGQNSPNSPDHIHSLITTASEIRDRLSKLFTELVI